ncbi:MAG: twin-arginine translocase subunit TatC [Candidatus Omnitrophica bacterium]|nr:twin-arginine translocase subunit TatC [Candidatus Omnitrophota bacterium]MDE2222157.1 twin-arginine translocase subunit TatC [Candidatus Omnitrophota bacterium]
MNLSPFFQSFFKHLEELRSRLIKSAGAFVLAFCVCYGFIGKLLPVLIAPAGHLVFTAPAEAFAATMTIGTVLALFVSSPYIVYQIWAFVGAALKPSERKFVVFFAPLSLLFFLSGGAFAYFIAVPRAYRFLMSFASPYMIPMVTVKNYLGFLGHMIVAFGVAFELPLVLAFLAKIGIASPEFLRQKRRHAVVAILILAAILAPPDVISMLILALPLLALYEVGIVMVRFFYRPSWPVQKHKTL